MTTFGQIEEFDRAECFRRLATSPVGRVAYSRGSRIVVLPFNISVDGDDILVRTRPGPTLDAARSAQSMTVEVDGFDPVDHTGWSVVARGPGREVRSIERAGKEQRAPVTAWARPDAAHLIAIEAVEVTGRAIGPGLAATDSPGSPPMITSAQRHERLPPAARA